MQIFSPGWYLIYTRPRHERKVGLQLAEKNIDFFLPTRSILKKWHDRKKVIQEPFFPSYVFVHLKDTHAYYEGLDITGAVGYVRFGKDIARVSDVVVNNTKILVSKMNEIEVSDQYFDPGNKVVIKQGALAGLDCEIVKHKQDQKLLVRINLLHRSLLVNLPEENLIAI